MLCPPWIRNSLGQPASLPWRTQDAGHARDRPHRADGGRAHGGQAMGLPGMFGQGQPAPDEVRASSILSADGFAVSVLLSGLRVALPADAGSARRSFGFELATRPPGLPPRVVVQMRGGTVLGTGTRAYLLATFAGRAGLVEVKADAEGDFLVELGVDWPRGGGLHGRIVLLLARDAGAAAVPASLALESIDLAARLV